MGAQCDLEVCEDNNMQVYIYNYRVKTWKNQTNACVLLCFFHYIIYIFKELIDLEGIYSIKN